MSEISYLGMLLETLACIPCDYQWDYYIVIIFILYFYFVYKERHKLQTQRWNIKTASNWQVGISD